MEWFKATYVTLYPRGPPSELIGAPLSLTEDAEGEDHDETPLIERFFGEVYVPAMLWPPVPIGKGPDGKPKIYFLKIPAIISVIFTLVLAIVCAVFASQLQTPIEEEKWFPSQHMFASVMTDSSKLYMQGSNDQFEIVNLFVGLDSMDRTQNSNGAVFDKYNPGENRGSVVYDAGLSIVTLGEQAWFNETCTTLSNTACTTRGCFGGKLIVPGTVSCVLEDLRSWLAQSFVTPSGLYADTPTDFVGIAGELPSTKVKMVGAVQAYYAKNKTAERERMVGIVGGEIKYVAISARASLKRWTVQVENEGSLAGWDNFVDQRRAAAPASLASLKHTSGAWGQLVMQKALVTGMRTGLFITFPISFAVLLFATHNILVAFIGISAIIAIVLCVLGWCYAIQGWYLGISESIAAVMIVGLAVDYVVHLAHMYLEADGPGVYSWFWTNTGEGRPLAANSREARFRYAAVKMGGTVLGGAGTTFGAGVIMFACTLLFFEKFAVLISVTIMFSLIYSMFFFMPLMALIGPNGNFTDIIFLAKHLVLCCVCKGGAAVEAGEGDEEVSVGETFYACKKTKQFAIEAFGFVVPPESTVAAVEAVVTAKEVPPTTEKDAARAD